MRKVVLVAASAIALGSTVALSGCASLARQAFAQPVVTLKDVHINGLGLTGGSMDVLLNVYNPNHFRLDATQLHYTVKVDTVQFATGTLDQAFTVQENDSTTVRIPIDFTYAGIGQAGRQLLNTGSVNYRVLGDVKVGSPISVTVPFDRTGRFSALGGTTR